MDFTNFASQFFSSIYKVVCPFQVKSVYTFSQFAQLLQVKINAILLKSALNGGGANDCFG